MRGRHAGFDARSGDEQREVWRLAELGQLHPDPQLASLSIQWARVTSASWTRARLMRRALAEFASVMLQQSSSADRVYNEWALARAILKADAARATW